MPSPKGYVRDELLDRAVELFRKQGYAGTSTAELVEGLGVNRKSLYAEFGSKQGLFEAVLERYCNTHLSRVLAPIEAPDADAEAIRRAMGVYASAIDSDYSGLGCLMANTAVERAALDAASKRWVDAYLNRLQAGFRQALGRAQAAGQVSSNADLDDLASGFAMAVVGISALVRADASSQQVKAAGRAAASLLEHA